MMVYHGTNKKNAKSILKTGFNEHTQWTHDFASAMEFGGNYVFHYDNPKIDKDSYWEWFDTPPLSECALFVYKRKLLWKPKDKELWVADCKEF